jgi:hypothetical protein
MKNFGVNSIVILRVLAKKIFYLFKIRIVSIFNDICGKKNGRTKKFAPSSFGAVVGSGILDEQKSGSGINFPDPHHWLDQKICFYDGATRPYARSTVHINVKTERYAPHIGLYVFS